VLNGLTLEISPIIVKLTHYIMHASTLLLSKQHIHAAVEYIFNDVLNVVRL